MRSYLKNTENFVAMWTAKLKLPYLEVKYVKEYDCKVPMKASIDCENSLIIFNIDRIESENDLIMTAMHEVCHFWYYYKYNNTRYLEEKRIIHMTYKLLEEYYPKTFKHAVNYGLLFISTLELEEIETEHHFGYLSALQKLGVITHHVKKC